MAKKDKVGAGDKPAARRVLDFTNVTERNFNTKHVPEGDYLATISKVIENKSKSSGNLQWVLTFDGKGGAVRGAKYPYYCGLRVEDLWKIRSVYIAAGFNVPKKKMDLDPQKLIGKDVGISLEDDEYDGKLKSVISAVIPASEIESPVEEMATEDDEEVSSNGTNGKAPSGKAKKKQKVTAGKGKGKKSSSDDLEEIDIEEI